MCSKPTIDDQIALEGRAVLDGYQRFLDRMEAHRARGEAGESKVGIEVQSRLLGEVTGHIRTLVAQNKGKAGRPPSWLALVRDLDPEALAAEALSVGWSSACAGDTLVSALVTLGDRAMLLAEVQTLSGALGAEQAQKTVKRVVTQKPRVDARRKALSSKAAKVGFEPWSTDTRVHVGGLLWNALCLTGLWECWSWNDRATKFVGLTETGERLALETTHALAWARPVLLPTLVAPRPWVSLNDGGYYTPQLQARTAMVRTRSKDHRKIVAKAIKDGTMAPAIAALNAIQATPFQVRREVFDLVEWAWGKGLALKKFPTRTKVTPSLPWDLEYMANNSKEKAMALQSYYKAINYNRGITSNTAAMRRDLETGRWLVDLPEFYLPHSLDFRGRVYPIPSYNHQRSDYVKGTFRFARGRTLGAEGLRALHWHIANTGDFDKISKKSWDERVQWTKDNLDLVLRVAKDPRNNLEWTRADKPFSFYHACLELSEALALDNPEDYVSHLPVDLDGSNSGVQHYSAMLRAPEGALVNLTPSAQPADLYAAVAKVIRDYAETVAAPSVDPQAYQEGLRDLQAARAARQGVEEIQETLEPLVARLWLDYGISRSEVKRPTMTRGYGSETYGFRSQIIHDLMEPLSVEVMTGKRPSHPFGADDGAYAATWMAKRIWEALAQILVKTTEGMEYLQEVAGALAKADKAVTWTTPGGFPVVQRYEETETRQVQVLLYGREVQVKPWAKRDAEKPRSLLRAYYLDVAQGTTGVLVRHRQRNAVAPNFVHSLDACHLMMSVLRAGDRGIQDFLLVHDSFATHASDIEAFGKAIREALVDLYENHDPLEAFHRAAEASIDDPGITLPAIPQKGSLDLQGVLQAPYTFS